MRVTHEFFGTRFVGQLILGRQPSLVYYVDPWGLPWCRVRSLNSKEGLMSFRIFPGGLPRRFRVVQQSFLQRDDLAFADVLSEQDIQAAFDAEGVTLRKNQVMSTPRLSRCGPSYPRRCSRPNIAVAWRPWCASRS